MGSVFRKSFTKSLPAGAETFLRKGQRLARWKDRRGKTRTALLTEGQDGSERITIESPFFVAKYRDGSGIVREVATGCRDEQAARSVLADLERRAELVKAGVMTPKEDQIADHQAIALAEHVDAFRKLADFQGRYRCTPQGNAAAAWIGLPLNARFADYLI